MRLTSEETDVLASVEEGEWRRVEGFDTAALSYRDAARATLRKDRRVNIRISERDLLSLQRRAIAEGLPYQTLISSILHRYVNGRLADRA
jgi:predicted DNA binding CopG/RHH family protein